jgi:hypothetical protein
VQALKRDKNVLMLELVRLRQQQQARLCDLFVALAERCFVDNHNLTEQHDSTICL